jgi:hypothetical protein
MVVQLSLVKSKTATTLDGYLQPPIIPLTIVAGPFRGPHRVFPMLDVPFWPRGASCTGMYPLRPTVCGGTSRGSTTIMPPTATTRQNRRLEAARQPLDAFIYPSSCRLDFCLTTPSIWLKHDPYGAYNMIRQQWSIEALSISFRERPCR